MSSHIKQSSAMLAAAVLCAAILCSAAAWSQDQAKSQPPVSSALPANAAPSASADTPQQHVAGAKSDTYIIGAEDQVLINVWKETELTRTVPVRPDGMISLPLLGDIKAAGYTPLQLQDQITEALKKYVSDPQVTVIVTEVRSLSFNIVGEINKPGFYPLTRRLTVLDAVAMAGGFKDFAKTKKVYVLRVDASGKEERLPFNYKAVIKGQDSSQNIQLQPHDTVVVP